MEQKCNNIISEKINKKNVAYKLGTENGFLKHTSIQDLT
jgi:hypothetical protein